MLFRYLNYISRKNIVSLELQDAVPKDNIFHSNYLTNREVYVNRLRRTVERFLNDCMGIRINLIFTEYDLSINNMIFRYTNSIPSKYGDFNFIFEFKLDYYLEDDELRIFHANFCYPDINDYNAGMFDLVEKAGVINIDFTTTFKNYIFPAPGNFTFNNGEQLKELKRIIFECEDYCKKKLKCVERTLKDFDPKEFHDTLVGIDEKVNELIKYKTEYKQKILNKYTKIHKMENDFEEL